MSTERNLVLELIQASAANQPDRIRSMAMDYAEHLAGEGDQAAARTIHDAYEIRRDLPIGLYPLKARKTLSDLDLPPEVAGSIDDFLTEQREVDALKAAGMEPRHKVLLIGPPGNGKTVLAGAVSIALGVPSFMVRYDDLISKTPGETSRNLLTLFNYARRERCLLFFDEFDALGRERGDAQESGEMKRVTSTLLVQIDDIPSHVVCMAATNHAQMLDAAIWRRFNIRIELPKPRLSQFENFMCEFSEQIGYPMRALQGMTEIDLDIVSHRASFENFSDAELFVRNVVRAHVLSRGSLDIPHAIAVELDKWTSGQRKVMI